MMRAQVQENFQSFNDRFESTCTWMYLDVKGLVTTGVGNLIDSIPAAQALPWTNKDGSPCTMAQVQGAWNTVKMAQSLKRLGGGHFQGLTSIRLTADGIASLVATRRDLDWSFLLGRFPGLPTWPADGQMGVLSIAWAAGPGWRAPNFDKHSVEPDYLGLAQEAWLNDAGNPGLHPRNLANQTLFMNCDKVVNGRGFDPEVFYYPQTLA